MVQNDKILRFKVHLVCSKVKKEKKKEMFGAVCKLGKRVRRGRSGGSFTTHKMVVAHEVRIQYFIVHIYQSLQGLGFWQTNPRSQGYPSCPPIRHPKGKTVIAFGTPLPIP